MYVIRLQNCAFFARHGVFDAEKALGQRFYVDAELTVDAQEALESDDIAETISYADVFKIIESLVTTERFALIEALAHAIGKRLLAAFPVITVVEITVRKPSVPIEGVLDHVAVTVVLP